MVEFMIGSSIMIVLIIGALSLYVSSNKIAVDQREYTELQHNVRATMFFVSRDVRSTGVGLDANIAGYFLEGQDGYGPGVEASDYIKLLGNFGEQVGLKIEDYSGSASTAFLYDWELEHAPYDCPEFYENKVFLIVSTTCPGCFAYRFIPSNSMFGCGSGTAHFNFQPGKSDLNPPGGLSDTNCSDDCYDDAIVTIGQVIQYWLDTTGNPGDYPDLNLTVGNQGYLGVANTLYMSTIDNTGNMLHRPLAHDIENLQFRYNGDFDDDGNLDGFVDWDNQNWTILPGDDSATKQAKMDIISRIRQVRIWVLGCTKKAFVGKKGSPSSNIHLYRRPAVANSPAASQDDNHRRFLLTSVSNIRNLSLNLYNMGTR